MRECPQVIFVTNDRNRKANFLPLTLMPILNHRSKRKAGTKTKNYTLVEARAFDNKDRVKWDSLILNDSPKTI